MILVLVRLGNTMALGAAAWHAPTMADVSWEKAAPSRGCRVGSDRGTGALLGAGWAAGSSMMGDNALCNICPH